MVSTVVASIFIYPPNFYLIQKLLHWWNSINCARNRNTLINYCIIGLNINWDAARPSDALKKICITCLLGIQFMPYGTEKKRKEKAGHPLAEPGGQRIFCPDQRGHLHEPVQWWAGGYPEADPRLHSGATSGRTFFSMLWMGTTSTSARWRLLRRTRLILVMSFIFSMNTMSWIDFDSPMMT